MGSAETPPAGAWPAHVILVKAVQLVEEVMLAQYLGKVPAAQESLLIRPQVSFESAPVSSSSLCQYFPPTLLSAPFEPVGLSYGLHRACDYQQAAGQQVSNCISKQVGCKHFRLPSESQSTL